MPDANLNQIEPFLLGALEQQEEQQLLAHLAAGCTDCNKAIAATARVMHALPWALLSPADSPVELVAPPAALKQRLLNSIKEDKTSEEGSPQVWKSWAENAAPLAGLLTVHAHEGTWENIGISDIKVKRLFVDQAHDSVTMLVRMPPGAAYPSHRHSGTEQCYVLEGDLHVGDLVFHAGDYQCSDSNSIHGVQHTKAGCLLLIVSSLHDEILAA
ncbi:MAG: hypothetical protein ALAOOOJD_03754 [bacterium]|nr:hypothetical protein [bacterium]